MVAALKARGIPVAGADRISLADQIAVQDLLALGDFLTLPEDDLALAAVLKSPLFGFDDDDLLAIAPKRKGTLWKALLDSGRHQRPPSRGRGHPQALAQGGRLRVRRSSSLPTCSTSDGMRRRLLARLGPEAADPIDEFLSSPSI